MLCQCVESQTPHILNARGSHSSQSSSAKIARIVLALASLLGLKITVEMQLECNVLLRNTKTLTEWLNRGWMSLITRRARSQARLKSPTWSWSQEPFSSKLFQPLPSVALPVVLVWSSPQVLSSFKPQSRGSNHKHWQQCAQKQAKQVAYTNRHFAASPILS